MTTIDEFHKTITPQYFQRYINKLKKVISILNSYSYLIVIFKLGCSNCYLKKRWIVRLLRMLIFFLYFFSYC
jgi:hypothetical protein